MRRVLMVAYHFPPLAGSSGIQRTLRFVQQLPQHGWEPIVLTANPLAYDQTSSDLLGEVPTSTPVHRAWALNTSKHLAIGGRYIASMARPDRWVSWRLAAVPLGMHLIRKYRPDVIWSTYPIATAHLIGARLAARSGVPWVADFRDPMAQSGYPADPETWKQFKQIETEAVSRAAHSVFTTPGAADEYRRRYPNHAGKIAVIENGYDESSFSAASNTSAALEPGKFTLLHSGIVYPSERDPRPLFAALGRLKREGVMTAEHWSIRFRASDNDAMLSELARKYDITDLIKLLPPIRYREALSEMLSADGLLVMQGRGCNAQIPAKAYEYIRARRPILALADPVGDTAGLLRNAGVQTLAALEDEHAVEGALRQFSELLRNGNASVASDMVAQSHSRESRTLELARLFDQIVG
ncbi:glycosyltransferase [Niveibacterium microcysteis]|uniref:Glycosyltransferase n=1 Tax=Niveibacterium microcysteis TaxID=2811415 RepID=A0ABX7M8T6_9RHOO|nr:glycosyltransferase [Niveibacterium microcysteis]QSI78155.1 glycosyltransferase [Niveibacterium microcysteis]